MFRAQSILNARREFVIKDYESVKAKNRLNLLEGDDKATTEYIFPNQMEDAHNIVNKFYENKRRVISIQKKTKVGADGLMIEIAKLLTTHSDDEFVVNLEKVRIITGMSNAGWEKDMIEKAPSCFKDKIFHHGKLSKSDLKNMRDGLIIIDEIDTGDKEFQVLHNTLKEAGVLDVNHMEENNNRFVFISATMIKELYDLYRWGELHELYKMTIPEEYIGHKDFIEKGIVKEFYSLNSAENAEKWVQEDILDNYGDDYRVHIVRVAESKNNKTALQIQNACIRKGISYRNHTSTDRLSEDEIKEFFKEPLSQHIVLGVKGFFRRANLIPNRWKLRIGATHEYYTKKVDNNVQIQGLIGRMTGYWRYDIDSGHKTGPHRTSIKAIEEYEKIYNDPFGLNSYQTTGFKKKNGRVSSDPTMLSPHNILNLESVHLPVSMNYENIDPNTIPEQVPIVIQITSREYSTMKKSGREWDYSTICSIISKYNPEIIVELERIKENGGKDQIVQPRRNASTYGVYITEFVNASNNNERKHHIGNMNDKKKDTFQIYLDNIENRIIISIYYGSRNNTSL
jgi:hypothetical protein